MTDKIYDSIFIELFEISASSLNADLVYQSIDNWDSVGHMELISRVEDAFGINLEMDDVIDFGSYLEGKRILSKYGVIFNESS